MSENPWIPLLELTGTFKIDDLPEFEAGELITRADKARDDAEKEISYAQAISEILERKGESAESQKSLVTIGMWHFECAVELFSKAIRNYERARARGLSKNRQTDIEMQIRICHDYLTTVAEQKKISPGCIEFDENVTAFFSNSVRRFFSLFSAFLKPFNKTANSAGSFG